jgi:hypothetical protein
MPVGLKRASVGHRDWWITLVLARNCQELLKTMKACLPLRLLAVVLCFMCEAFSFTIAAFAEPSGGLVGVALELKDLDPVAEWRRIRFQLDSQCSPPGYYHPTGDQESDLQGIRYYEGSLKRAGAEAVVYLDYLPQWLSVKILRFTLAEKAQAYWLRRQHEGEGRLETISGEPFLVTERDRLFRPGARAGARAVECRSGRYVVRVTDGRHSKLNPEIGFALKQLQKIRSLREPDGAANLSQPIRTEPNRASVAAGSDR